MTIRVLLFAWLADHAGAREVQVGLQAGATVEDAVRSAGETLGATLDPAGFAVALNERYSDLSATVREGDVIALIPPVSGG